MKLPIVFLAVLGLVCGKSIPIGSLKDDVKEVIELVPHDKVIKIVLDYLHTDPEVHELLSYIHSEKFPKIHTIVEHLKEYKECLITVDEHVVDLYEIVKEIYVILGLPPFIPTHTKPTGVGIYGLIDDVLAVLPLDDLKELYYVKLETREYFKALVTYLKSPVFMKMLDTVQSSPEYLELLEIVRNKVVDVDRIIELIRLLYLRVPLILKEDLKEFMVLVPKYEVIHLTLDYLAHDTELHELSAYIQSEEFPKIHALVEYIKEYKPCLKFITDYGVDVHAYLIELYDVLGLPPLPPTNVTRMGVGVYGLVEDVIALLPLYDLKTLFEVKLETREYFKKVVTTIHTPLFLDMVDTVRALPEYKKLLEILREHVVDVDLIIKHLKELWVLFGLPPL